jgi:hypothetical protein
MLFFVTYLLVILFVKVLRERQIQNRIAINMPYVWANVIEW